MKIGIGFAVLNNFKGFAEAVHSIKSQHETQIIVADQWRFNKPLSQAWNDMAMQAFDEGCDYAVICNDDILFSPDCIDAMVRAHQALNESEGVVMVTPNNIMLELPSPEAILDYRLPDGIQTSWSEHPNFSCFLVARDFFEKVGFFDENFIPAWYEDNDSHYRAKLLGFKEICTTSAPMVHFGGVSTSLMENPNSQHSHDYFMKKWGSVNRSLDETFKVPYDDHELTPAQWKRADGSLVGPISIKEVQS